MALQLLQLNVMLDVSLTSFLFRSIYAHTLGGRGFVVQTSLDTPT